jgi:hypothetical protein
MRENSHELVRLNRRIAEVQRSIEQAEGNDSQPWGRAERVKVLALLNKTLKALEARKAAFERAKQ